MTEGANIRIAVAAHKGPKYQLRKISTCAYPRTKAVSTGALVLFGDTACTSMVQSVLQRVQRKLQPILHLQLLEHDGQLILHGLF